MPVAPRRPCAKPGCAVLTHTTYCELHLIERKSRTVAARIQYDNERGTSASRGYGSRWNKYSKQFRLNNPLCEMCKKKKVLTKATCVDHIEPVSGPDDEKFWLESNHQSLCASCHSEKTAKEDGGFGNRKERFF